MNIIKNKKGISTVVATALILLLTVAALAILARFLFPFVSDNLGRASECLKYKDYFNFVESYDNGSGTYRYNCYLKSGSNYLTSTMIQATDNTTDGNLLGFKIVYKNDSFTNSMDVNPTITNKKAEGYLSILGDSSSNNLAVPLKGEIITYVYNSPNIYDEVEVYPVLKSGRVCDKNDNIMLQGCQSGINLML